MLGGRQAYWRTAESTNCDLCDNEPVWYAPGVCCREIWTAPAGRPGCTRERGLDACLIILAEKVGKAAVHAICALIGQCRTDASYWCLQSGTSNSHLCSFWLLFCLRLERCTQPLSGIEIKMVFYVVYLWKMHPRINHYFFLHLVEIQKAPQFFYF